MGTVKVFELCIVQIHLESEWILREKNQLDYLSRIIDYDDWCLDPSMFARLDNSWGSHIYMGMHYSQRRKPGDVVATVAGKRQL